jgi:hypothetical protein
MLITKEQIVGDNRMAKQDKINLFESLLMSTGRSGMDKVIEYLRKTDFYTAPASAKYHSNYDTGLLDHSLMVYNLAEAFFEKMKMIDPELAISIPEESIIVSALLHDVCKICFYRKTIKWKKNEHNDWMQYDGYEIEDSFPIGHGEKSVIMLLKLGLDINPCEMLAIRYHMGFWGESNIEFKIAMKSAIKMCPLVVLLQQADCASTMMFEKEIEI